MFLVDDCEVRTAEELPLEGAAWHDRDGRATVGADGSERCSSAGVRNPAGRALVGLASSLLRASDFFPAIPLSRERQAMSVTMKQESTSSLTSEEAAAARVVGSEAGNLSIFARDGTVIVVGPDLNRLDAGGAPCVCRICGTRVRAARHLRFAARRKASRSTGRAPDRPFRQSVSDPPRIEG